MRLQKLLTIVFIVLALLTINLTNSIAGSVDRNGTRIAIDSYDPVAYHTKGRPAVGYSDLYYKHKGMNWYFCSEKNKELFIKDKKKYSPAYTGHCAYCISHYGMKKKSDPRMWSIVDGRLFLFSNEQRKEKWEGDAESIKKGDENWRDTRYQ